MASKLSWRSELHEHVIEGPIQETGKRFGRGSYGEVVEMTLGGRKVAGKRIHSIFLESEDHGKEDMIQRFKEECIRYRNMVMHVLA